MSGRRSPLSVTLLLAFVISMLAMSNVSYAASSQITFSSIKNLSIDSGASTAPVVATVNFGGKQYVYVAWEDTSTTNGKRATFFQVSSNGGSTWLSSPVIFGGLKGPANKQTSGVQIAAVGQYVYLTWQQGPATGYAVSSNNGGTFTFGLLSDGSASGQGGVGSPAGKMTSQAISSNGTSAYFTWRDQENNGSSTIQFSATYDGGAHFTSPVRINNGASALHSAREDESFATGKYLYVVWDSIWASASSNGGKPGSWTDPALIRPVSCVFPCVGREPMVYGVGSNVYVTFPMGGFNGSGSYSAEIVVSHDHGQTWAPALNVSAPLTTIREVQVAAYGNNVYVTSRGTQTGMKGPQQYVYISHDAGNTFGAPHSLPPFLSQGETGFGGLSVDPTNGYVYIQWPHGTPAQMYVARTQDGGSTWSTNQQFSSSSEGVVGMGDPSGGQGPYAAAGNGHVYLVWEDLSTGNGDIYFVSGT